MLVFVEERCEDVHGKEEVSGKDVQGMGAMSMLSATKNIWRQWKRVELQSQPAACGGLQASLAVCDCEPWSEEWKQWQTDKKRRGGAS